MEGVAVHVDGVWWHGRPDYFTPGKRGPYWDEKIAGNQRRDVRVDKELRKIGWRWFRVFGTWMSCIPATVLSE